jgi:nitroreductase
MPGAYCRFRSRLQRSKSIAQGEYGCYPLPMLNDTSSTLSLLHTRRSGKPRDMVAPGPDDSQLHAILQAAIRVPDHGKLNPWRFVVVEADQRDRLAQLIVGAFRAEQPLATDAQIEAMEQYAHQAPTLVVVLSSPIPGKIALWEQQLSAGAACMNLLTATHASGFVGGWLTGWPAYSDTVRDAFAGPGDRIAGFIFIGSPLRELSERPRAAFEEVVSHWS